MKISTVIEKGSSTSKLKHYRRDSTKANVLTAPTTPTLPIYNLDYHQMREKSEKNELLNTSGKTLTVTASKATSLFVLEKNYRETTVKIKVIQPFFHNEGLLSRLKKRYEASFWKDGLVKIQDSKMEVEIGSDVLSFNLIWVKVTQKKEFEYELTLRLQLINRKVVLLVFSSLDDFCYWKEKIEAAA